MVLPDAIHEHAGRKRVVPTRHPTGEVGPTGGRSRLAFPRHHGRNAGDDLVAGMPEFAAHQQECLGLTRPGLKPHCHRQRCRLARVEALNVRL